MPDRSAAALLLIDVINDCEFDEADALLEHALPAAEHIAALRRQARALGVPAIYVNDNFGRWRSERSQILGHCRRAASRGRRLVQKLAPHRDDYFVLKPMHSGFFSTTLEVLLQHLGARRLVLTGVATDFCVLFTANDAYMRRYELWIPADCVAANSLEKSRAALGQMRHSLKAETRPTSELTLQTWLSARAGREAREPRHRTVSSPSVRRAPVRHGTFS